VEETVPIALRVRPERSPCFGVRLDEFKEWRHFLVIVTSNFYDEAIAIVREHRDANSQVIVIGFDFPLVRDRYITGKGELFLHVQTADFGAHGHRLLDASADRRKNEKGILVDVV
jgi:hypothetical protein